MKFKYSMYIDEMKKLIDDALDKINRENPEFEIYTVSIWTDANAAASAINFDSKSNSDIKCRKSNEFNEEQKKYWTSRGGIEMAKLFEPETGRNCNPADFHLRNFSTIKNRSVPSRWEERTDGKCWTELEPALKEVGEYTFQKMTAAKVRSDLEVGVNGKLDWYQFTWAKVK
jgi:hypothetical protein